VSHVTNLLFVIELMGILMGCKYSTDRPVWAVSSLSSDHTNLFCFYSLSARYRVWPFTRWSFHAIRNLEVV
jgi:hypothetical protein